MNLCDSKLPWLDSEIHKQQLCLTSVLILNILIFRVNRAFVLIFSFKSEGEEMGRRALTVYEMSFRQKRAKNPASFAPSNLEGKDLLDIFEVWVRSLRPADTKIEAKQTWLSVSDVSRYAPRVLLVNLRVGFYGEKGDVVDVDKNTTVGTISTNHAPTGHNRVLLFVPETGERAFFFSEESSRGHAGGVLRNLFKTHFSKHISKITMEFRPVTESEVWLEAANLTEVEVRVEGRSVDIADRHSVKVGRVSYVAHPARRNFFPRKLLKGITKEEILKRVMSVDDLPADRTVFVKFERDGRKKKFIVGKEDFPQIREILNEHNEPILPDKELVKKCVERVENLCERHDFFWDSSWSTPEPNQ